MSFLSAIRLLVVPIVFFAAIYTYLIVVHPPTLGDVATKLCIYIHTYSDMFPDTDWLCARLMEALQIELAPGFTYAQVRIDVMVLWTISSLLICVYLASRCGRCV